MTIAKLNQPQIPQSWPQRDDSPHRGGFGGPSKMALLAIVGGLMLFANNLAPAQPETTAVKPSGSNQAYLFTYFMGNGEDGLHLAWSADGYTDHRYEAKRSRDLKTWEDISSKISFPKGTRHGTAIAVPMELIRQLQMVM